MDSLFDLSGDVVIVTGALGQLGGIYSRALAARGAKVAMLDVREDAAAAVPGGISIAADVTDRASLEAALERIKRELGVPSGLINNAALDSPPDASGDENGPFETYPESSWDKVMAVNAKGVFLCCQVFGGCMAAVGRGSIVNVASIYGMVSPDQALYEYRRQQGEVFFKPVAYAASKSSLYNLTRYLAAYWGRKGVRVNALSLAGVFNNQNPAFLEGYEGRIPVGRMARSDEYDGAIVFLLSRASSYMTGANLVVDGGWTAI